MSRPPKGEVAVGEEFTLEIGAMVHGGHCLAYPNGNTAFSHSLCRGRRDREPRQVDVMMSHRLLEFVFALHRVPRNLRPNHLRIGIEDTNEN